MKTHDITVTIMQAIVLLMFNNSALDQPLGYLEIKQKIGTLLFDNDPTLLNTLAAISFDSR